MTHQSTSNVTSPRLVLFDIDGTLMITKGASSRCMKRAGKLVFGPTFSWSPVTVGTLDPQIFDQLAAANNVTPTDEQREQYQIAYLDSLDQELHDRQADIVLMPGIKSLVERLHLRTLIKNDIVLGVLTGNFRRAAYLKLTLSGLGIERFRIIVCAEDGQARDELPQVAIRRAEEHLGSPISASDTFIVGDTPRDIECAAVNGCHCIAVATGHYSKHELLNTGGKIVLDSLADTDKILSLLTHNNPKSF